MYDYRTFFYIIFGALAFIVICLCVIEREILKVEDKVNQLLEDYDEEEEETEG